MRWVILNHLNKLNKSVLFKVTPEDCILLDNLVHLADTRRDDLSGGFEVFAGGLYAV